MLKKVLIFVLFYCIWVGVTSSSIFGWCKACLAPGPLQLLAILGYLVLIMIPMVLFLKFMNAKPGWMKKVEAEGKRAPATILGVKDTGMVINNTISVVKLQLRVEPPNEAPFEVSQEKQISLLIGLGRYSAGAHVDVKYDPGNKNHLIILSEPDTSADYRPTPSHPASEPVNPKPDVAQALQELSKLHKSGELSDSEFAAAKKKLLG